MNIVKNEKGITIVALVITIIILLILVGVTLIITNNLIIDKAVLANNKTIEAILKEQIEIAWVDAEASYIENTKSLAMNSKETYLKQAFLENLQNLEEFSEIIITGEVNERITGDFKYKNESYSFVVSPEGIAKIVYLLKGNVKVGDYIEYPIEYYDVYTGEYCSTQNGWMVIDDGVMLGTAGVVRITSTHIPAKWYFNLSEYSDNITAVEELVNNFENSNIYHNTQESNENAEGVHQPIKGGYFKVNPIAEKVSAMTLSDLNFAYNKAYGTNRPQDEVSLLDDKDEVFHIRDPGVYWWLATVKPDSNTNLYYVSTNEIKDEANLRLGIRPVISLKENLIGDLDSNIWKIIN